jgi:hypothetical protein
MKMHFDHNFNTIAPIIAAKVGTLVARSNKSAGVLSATPMLDNKNRLLGGALGALVGAAPIIANGYHIDDLRLALAGLVIGGAIGGAFDQRRLRAELKGKTISDYKPNAAELKAKGFSEDEIHDLLYAPLFGQSVKKALDVYDKEPAIFRPISATIGKLLSMPTMNSLGIANETASLENSDIKAYLNAVKDHSALKNVGVYLGSERLLNKLYRTWKNPKYGFGSKIMNTLNFPLRSFSVAALGADHYDPSSDTVTLFHSDPAILSHEVGHAMDFSTAKDTALASKLYQKSPLNQEYLASNMAINALTKQMLNKSKDISQKELQKLKDNAMKLRRAFNTYDRVFRPFGVQTKVRQRLDTYPYDPYDNPYDSLKAFMTDPKLVSKLNKLLKKHDSERDQPRRA